MTERLIRLRNRVLTISPDVPLSERMVTHHGCPMCRGSRKAYRVMGDSIFQENCQYYGQTYRALERAQVYAGITE